MSRSPILLLALLCALSCSVFGQAAGSEQQTPPPPATSPNPPAPQSNAPNAPPAAPQAPAEPAAPKASPEKVAMTAPVITLKGACTASAATKEAAPAKTGTAAKTTTAAAKPGCVSVITRGQFEKLIDALTPPDRPAASAEMKRNFATQYAKLLTFANAARALGLQNDPRVLEIMKFAQTQVLMEELNAHYTKEYQNPTDKQIEDYYNQNLAKYKEATLERIIIPHNAGTPEGADKPKPSEADEKAFMDKIRERWAAGEDPTKLEKEAMDHAGVSTQPPDVKVGARRPGTLPIAHEVVFDLKPGQVSEVFSDPGAGYIYKVVSVRQIPLSEVRASIVTTLQRQNLTDKIQSIQSSATPELNETYFGPAAPPSVNRSVIPGRPNMPGPRGGMPPGGRVPPPAGNPQGAPPPAPQGSTPPPAQQAPPQ